MEALITPNTVSTLPTLAGSVVERVEQNRVAASISELPAAQTLHAAKPLQVVKTRVDAAMCVETSKGKYVDIKSWHKALYNALYEGERSLFEKTESNRCKMQKVIYAQYGAMTGPTYEQYMADRKALRILAQAHGLVSDLVVLRPYNYSIVELYGALPVSTSAEAQRKAAARALNAKPAKIGAEKGKPQDKATSPQETIEQFIARVGLAAVLTSCSKILASIKESQMDAAALHAISTHYKAA